jgi:hypothetical protein
VLQNDDYIDALPTLFLVSNAQLSGCELIWS